MIKLLSWAPVGGGGALVLAAQGLQLPDGGVIEVPAPEGAGMHVWQGELVVREDGVQALRGAWTRASIRDMEAWGVPLGEAAGADGWCCTMRQKFLIGILADNQAVPAPVDMVDFIREWEPKIVLNIRFCPFCGLALGGKSLVRMVS